MVYAGPVIDTNFAYLSEMRPKRWNRIPMDLQNGPRAERTSRFHLSCVSERPRLSNPCVMHGIYGINILHRILRFKDLGEMMA
jgi:hypothetical protein